MKLVGHVFLFTGLLLIVTWLNVRSADAERRQAQKGLEDLDRFTLVESMLHRDLLGARAGLSLNYDLLVERLGALRQLAENIQDHAVGAEERKTANRLAGFVSEEETLTEKFKSHNALLHNSLAYFGLFTSRLSGPDQPSELARSVSSLSTAMLHLTLNSSSGPEEVDQWLRALSPAELLFPGIDIDVSALLAHAEILRDLLPATDDVLAALFAIPDEQALDAIRDLIRARQKASADEARFSQYLLYTISMILVVLLGYLARGMQLRAQALRKRMALEHVIAERSTGLITSSETDIARSVEHALAALARTLGADRAYFAFRDEAGFHHWSHDGQPPSAGWIATALAASRKFAPGPANVVHIARGADNGDKQEFLAMHGLQGWICVPSAGPLRADAILGFDCLRHPPSLSRDEVAPKLLMLSGLGDRSELERHGIPLVQHLPGVGSNLQDHVSFGCTWECREPIPPRNNGSEATLHWKSRPELEAPDLLFCQVEFPVPSERTATRGVPAHGWTMFAGLAHLRSRGRLRLKSADPSAAPIVDANMMSDPADMKAARACVKLCRELGNAEAFRPYVKREAIPGDGTDADDSFIRDAAVTYWHRCGTARMGFDDMSVVGATLAVHDVNGLRVADGSILPRVTTGNTQAPCAIVGERAAYMIRRTYGL